MSTSVVGGGGGGGVGGAGGATTSTSIGAVLFSTASDDLTGFERRPARFSDAEDDVVPASVALILGLKKYARPDIVAVFSGLLFFLL